MEANKDIPAVTKHRSKLLDMAKCENVLQSDSSAVIDKDLQLHQVPEDLGCIADGDSWCLEDIHTTDPKIQVLALKALIVRKDKEYEEMEKCKKVLQEKVDQLGLFLKRYERLDEARTICNMKNQLSLERRVEDMMQEKNDVVVRLDQLEHNEVVEQLMISNEDLSQECLQLKEKLNETVNALAGVEEQMESLALAKLRETENCNNLACELALAQAKALHLEQLAHAQVGRMMSGEVKQSSCLLREPIVKESFSSRSSGSVKQNSSLLRESIGKENSSSRPSVSLPSGSVRQNSSLLRESIGKENSSSRPSGSVRQNSCLLREPIVQENSISLPSGSVRQNSSLLKESSSLRFGSVKQNSTQLGESIGKETKSKIPELGPTVAKVYSSIDKVPDSQVTEKDRADRTEVRSTSDHQPSKSEGHNNPLSSTVLTKQKVNYNLKENMCGDLRSPINFSDMDDNELCLYQLKLMEARDNGTDMDPVELDAQIKELNLYLSGQYGWPGGAPVQVTPRPCFVKFSVRGWRTTAAKIRAHFNLRGVTGVEVFGAAAVVSFNTPQDAKAVVDKDPHVVGNCHLVPGPVIMVEEGNGFMGSEIGAMCSKATCSVLDDGADDVVDRTVELFKTGEADEELLKTIPGVESATTDGNTVKLIYAEQNECEEVLENGYIMVGEEKMLVGRIGQLGWVEIEVTGTKGVLESEELLNLLEHSGIAPVLDILDRGGGMFGIVLENAKRKQLVKRSKLPLEGGMWATVVDGVKQFHGDLEKGEELAGKMIEPVEEEVKYTRPTNIKKDVNDNLIDEAIFTRDFIDVKRADCLRSGLQKVMNETQIGNKHFGYKNVKYNCPESFEEDTSVGEGKAKIGEWVQKGRYGKHDKEMEEPLEAMNASLGYSSSGTSNVHSLEEDCLPNPTGKKPFQIEVVKISLKSSKSENKKAANKTNETECQNTRARSTRSFNDPTDDHDSGEEVKRNQRNENHPVHW